MGDQQKGIAELYQLAEEDCNYKLSVSGKIQTNNSSSKAKPTDYVDSCLVSTPMSNAGTGTENPRPQHLALRKNKRKGYKLESTTCEECGKNFISLKAKYGHMRCHPERVARKMKKSSPQLSTLSITGKRCQAPSLFDEVHIAADILMQLSRDYSHLKGKQACNTEMAKTETKHLKIEMHSREPENPGMTPKSGTPKTYQCGICKMFFSTHQALGGHTASHNRRRNILDKGKMMMTESNVSVSAEDWITPAHRPSKASAMDHKCNICGSMFLSGQALGGHKRLHWTAPNRHHVSSLSSSTDI